MPPRARLALTALEDRTVPAGFGNAWVDTNLTVSFVPDGTDVAGTPSALFGTLGARMTAAEWQGVVRSVFQEWIAPTNLNVGFVADDGRPLGTPGPVQGSPDVGDIRISARPLSENVLAITNPFDLVSPWAGEIILNSNKVFSTDRAAGTADLRAVLLQEVGHALGVDNSADTSSVMYPFGGSSKLDGSDVTAIQALYGVRAADQYEGKRGNDSVGTAATLSYAQTSQRTEAVADLTTATDVDSYTATVPTNPADPSVVVRTAGLSQTQLMVTVYGDAKLATVLGTATAPDADGNYVLRLTGAAPKAPVYIRVEAAPGAGAFAVGGYAVSVGDGAVLAAPPAAAPWIATPSGKMVDIGDDAGTNNSITMATPLGQSRGGADARWDYVGVLNFDTPLDVDHYQFIPQKGAGGTLLVIVDTAAGGVAPDVAVMNQDGKSLPTTVLLRTATTMIVQAEGVSAGKSVVVRVRAADPASWVGPQSYRLGIDLRSEPVTLDPVADGTLTAAQPQLARSLEVTRSQGFRFQLTAAGADDAGARFVILDGTGAVVFSTVAASGQTVIGDVLLAPGTYTIVIVGGTKDGSPLTALQVTAAFMVLTDPIGPALVDEYTAPAVPTTDAAKTTPTTTTTTTTSATGGDGYYWLAPTILGSGFLAPTDLYSMVWW